MEQKQVYIVDGARTPFIKAKNKRGPFAASDLAVYAGRSLLSRLGVDPTIIGEVVVGCAVPSEDEANIARIIGLRLGCGKQVPGWTVQRNCASGMQSIDSAVKDIQMGRHDLVLAGGCEAMSRAPLMYRPEMVNWFAQMNSAKSVAAKIKAMTKFPFSQMSPIIGLLRGLTDPVVGVNMGQTAEIVAHEFGVTREEMDQYAMQSQLRLAKAQQENVLNEITTIYDGQGNYYNYDDGVRKDTTLEKLGKLKPNFDRKFGTVTPGNSSQITDGGVMLLLASEKAVKEHKLPVLGRVVDTHWAALAPEVMGLGPVMASTPLLQKYNYSLNDIDYWEINEAFAAQVLGCLRAWESEEFCKTHFGLDKAVGTLDQSRLNIDGGAIAVGHPIGASGSRIVLHTLEVLKRTNAKRGVATMCIGGGQGGAMLLETA